MQDKETVQKSPGSSPAGGQPSKTSNPVQEDSLVDDSPDKALTDPEINNDEGLIQQIVDGVQQLVEAHWIGTIKDSSALLELFYNDITKLVSVQMIENGVVVEQHEFSPISDEGDFEYKVRNEMQNFLKLCAVAKL